MSEFCCEAAWREAKQLAWEQRTLGDCRCDHNEYCEICWPLEFRAGGKWDKYVEPTVVKCDGNHGGPRCGDPECWNDSPPEPVAWRVYFPDEQRQEYCDNLDELIDDLTNCRHDEPEPLYTHPPAQRERLTDAWPAKPLKKVQVNINGVSMLAEPERAYFSAWAMQANEDALRSSLEKVEKK